METPSYGTVGEPNWGDRPCFIVGGGPSITPFKERLRELNAKGRVIAVNDSFRHCTPDVCFSLDHKWLMERLVEISSLPFPVFVAAEKEHVKPGARNLTFLDRIRPTGKYLLSTNPSIITNGLNSGYGALNYAFLRGAREIYLLGFDFQYDDKGRTHYHEGYKWCGIASKALLPMWAGIFKDTTDQLAQAGATVYNCNPDSLVRCFPFKPYSEVFG